MGPMTEPVAFRLAGSLGNGGTRLLGIFGDPVAHSLSPEIHNLAMERLGLNYRYLPFHVKPDHLGRSVEAFQILGGVGFNATVPHKEALVKYMDWLDPAAERVGAVNTVAFGERGERLGFNTDAYGFKTALNAGWWEPLRGKTVIVLGAGGAARSVLVALLDSGVGEIFLANRTLQRAEKLKDDFLVHYTQAVITPLPLVEESLPWGAADLLVNTTSLGLHAADAWPWSLEGLKKSAFVCDVVYSAHSTPLVRAAQRLGVKGMDGLGMLIHQAAEAFRIWTGYDMPVAAVKEYIYGKTSA